MQLPLRRLPPEYGDYYTNYHLEGSGWGGSVDHDGNSVQCVNNGNCRNTPVEILETKYPFIVEEYRLRPDSAGAGRWRGGLATSRTFRVDAPEIIVNALFDRTRTHGPGIFGGLGGRQQRHLHPASRRRPVPSLLGDVRNGLRFQVHARCGDRG